MSTVTTTNANGHKRELRVSPTTANDGVIVSTIAHDDMGVIGIHTVVLTSEQWASIVAAMGA